MTAPNPYEDLFKAQASMLEGMACLMSCAMKLNQHIIEAQMAVFHNQKHYRWHDIIPNGADWFDHYGKRNHDVDVEKL